MSAVVLGLIALGCVLGGLVLGMRLRNSLPDHHLSGDSRDAVKMGSGLIATLAALVLGLLVTSAKNSFDEMNNAIAMSSAKLIMLDQMLVQYGPQTQAIRSRLRESITKIMVMIWPECTADVEGAAVFENTPATIEQAASQLRLLVPQNDLQRTVQSEALQLCKELLLMRWVIIEQTQISLPPIFLVMLLFWLVILFGIFGLLAPSNKTAIAALVVCAMSVSGAVFLIEEMNRPFSGIVKISKAPLVKALEHIGRDVSISTQPSGMDRL